MSPFTLIHKMISPLLILNIASRYKGRAALMKIRVAQGYVSGVKKVRILFLSILLVMFSFVLLGSGLFLIHAALFIYSSWSSQVKFIVALALWGIEFVGAMGILFFLSREEVWVKFTGISKVLDSVVDGRSGNKKTKE